MSKIHWVLGFASLTGLAHGQTIRVQTREVLVDAVVTDKKGTYIHGLAASDFHVLEDGKDQKVTSVSFLADPARTKEGSDQTRYMVLFFANSAMNTGNQMDARRAATKFIDTNMAPGRKLAVVEFGGSLRVTQNFSDDADAVRKVVGGVKLSAANPLLIRALLVSLRDLAEGMAHLPGRKTVAFVSAGFTVNQENQPYLREAVDACNRANVALYPIDVRGLTPLNPQPSGMRRDGTVLPQTGGSTGGTPQSLITLAAGTSGFVIDDTNDLAGGLEKIAQEQNEYYVIAYTPPNEVDQGVCHTLKVRVDRTDVTVRSRNGYCEPKADDALHGTSAATELEALAAGNSPATLTGSLQASFVYTAGNMARADAVLEIPAGTFSFSKEKGRFDATTNILGIAYLPDGSEAARFSDEVKVSFEDKKEADAFDARPLRYEKQFRIAPGQYTLRVVFSSKAGTFGKREIPLAVEPWDEGRFALSGLAFSTDAPAASDLSAALKAAMPEQRVPLVVNGVEIVPAASNRFRKADRAFVYAEVYEPRSDKTPAMRVSAQLLDLKTGQVKRDLGTSSIVPSAGSASPAVPVGLRLQLADLEPGGYRLQVTAFDDAGHKTSRTAEIEID